MIVYVVIDEYRDLESHQDFLGVFGNEIEAYKYALKRKTDFHNTKVLSCEVVDNSVKIKPKPQLSRDKNC